MVQTLQQNAAQPPGHCLLVELSRRASKITLDMNVIKLIEQFSINNATQQEHYDIAANCIRGEWDHAAAAMLHHLENSKLSIVNYVMKTNRNARNVFEEDEDD